MENVQNKTITILSLGIPVKVDGRDKCYVIKKKVEVGKLYKMECPECGMSVVKKVQEEGIHKHICPNCHTLLGFGAKTPAPEPKPASAPEPKPTPTPAPETPSHNETHNFNMGKASKGEIVWGGMFHQEHRVIGLEKVTIGRKDKDEPSDISINDDYVSRRSVEIIPEVKDNGKVLYKFTINRTSNPVYVNGREMKVGESMYLNFGDKIKLGKTTLTFKKSNK